MAALVVGVVLGADPPTATVGLRLTYFHLLVVGWLTQLIFGVAHWLFPRASANAARGNERLGWAGFLLLNLGLLTRAGTETWISSPSRHDLLLASAVLQFTAILLLVLHIWPRVKER